MPAGQGCIGGTRITAVTATAYRKVNPVSLPANVANAFTARPDVLAAWQGLNGAIKSNMDLRRYELATLAAARELGSSYCSLVHGLILRDDFGIDVVDAAHQRSADGGGLDAVDIAVMDLAELVARGAASMSDADLQPLRDLGLTDDEIMDVILAASARCFFSTVLDALCVQPDAHFNDLSDDLREALVVGRPIESP